jgi:hypothetical protein
MQDSEEDQENGIRMSIGLTGDINWRRMGLLGALVLLTVVAPVLGMVAVAVAALVEVRVVRDPGWAADDEEQAAGDEGWGPEDAAVRFLTFNRRW